MRRMHELIILYSNVKSRIKSTVHSLFLSTLSHEGCLQVNIPFISLLYRITSHKWTKEKVPHSLNTSYRTSLTHTLSLTLYHTFSLTIHPNVSQSNVPAVFTGVENIGV